MGFPGASVVKNVPAIAANAGSIPGSEKSTGEVNGNPFQYWCLENNRQRSHAGYSPWGNKRAGHDLLTKKHEMLNNAKCTIVA